MSSKVVNAFILLYMLQQLLVVMAKDEDCNEILSTKSDKFNMTSTISRHPLSAYSPNQASLHNTHAWCAAVSNADQHLEIDLGLVMMIKSIAIQGNPNDDEFVKTFSLYYSVIESHWLTYLEIGAKRIFEGNSNRGEVTTQTLKYVTAARFVRITPETWFGHVCIRAELYGCDAAPFRPLGMMSGEIPNHAITGSISYTQHPTWYARLQWTKYGGWQCWAASVADVNQWLQIDLGRMEFVTAIATQGRHISFGQWVTSYSLSHSNDNTMWTEYKENEVKKVFTGNSDMESVVRHVLSSVIYVRFVKFRPVTWSSHISMRVEVYSFNRASPAALGMESGEITNNQITASTYYNFETPTHAAKLNYQLLQTCWAPSVNTGDQWLKINFGHTMLVTGIVTQGRGNGVARWVTGYQVTYSLDNSNWVAYKDMSASQTKTFQANTDDIGYVTTTFDRDIKAQFIRIHPKTWSPANAILGMRAEVLGRRKGPLGAPVFTNQDSSPNIVVYNNQEITLQCEAVGDLPITVAWSYKGSIIQSRTSNTHLNIQSVKTSQGGIYTCSATNALGSNTKTLHLKVKDPIDICMKHNLTFDDSRLTSTPAPNPFSDNTNIIESNWYVLYGTYGFYRIPNKCVPQNHCGAVAPGYIDGDLPAVSDGLVKRKVCFHSNGNCCHFSVYIYVRNCYMFYVYQLKKLDLSWKARYCVEEYVNGNPNRVFQAIPQSLALQHHVTHQLSSVTNDMSCMQYCMVDATCQTFNYNPKLASCELNNATADEYPHHMQTRPGYKYFYERKIHV